MRSARENALKQISTIVLDDQATASAQQAAVAIFTPTFVESILTWFDKNPKTVLHLDDQVLWSMPPLSGRFGLEVAANFL